MNMNNISLLSTDSWICPMCNDPLLTPVIADDSHVYNKQCFIKYFDTERGQRSISPMCEMKISKKYTSIHHIRTSVLTLITETNIFDQWISEQQYKQIIEYDLYQTLVGCKKINLMDDETKDFLKQIDIIHALNNNHYEKASDLIKQCKIVPTKSWIHCCESKLEDHAIQLLVDFPIDYNHVMNSGINGLLLACKNNMENLVLKLLEFKNLDYVQVQDHDGNDALMSICLNKNENLGLRFIESAFARWVNSINLNRVNPNGLNSLMMCCKKKMEKLALKLLDNEELDYSYVNNDNETALSIACYKGASKIAIALLKKPKTDYNFNRAFAIACDTGMDDEVIDQFIQIPNLEYNKVTPDGHNVLILSCYHEYSSIVLKLLNLPGIDVNYVDIDGDIAFHCACTHGLTEVVERMLEMNVNYNTVASYGNTGLILACENQHEEIALKLLNLPDIDINKINHDGYNAFYYACENDMISIIEKMLEIGVDYNQIFPNKKNALNMMCKNKNATIALKLLSMPNIDLNLVDQRGTSALIHCYLRENSFDLNWHKMNEVVDKMLVMGVNCNQQTVSGYTALLAACKYRGEPEILKLLDCPNINISQTMQMYGEDEPHDIFYYACQNNMIQVVKKLLPSYDITGNQKPLLSAYNNANSEIVLLIIDEIMKRTEIIDSDNSDNIDHDWDQIDKIMNQVDKGGYSLLMIACISNMIQVVDKMLSMGCDHNYVNPQTGKTALIIACENDHETIARKLLKQGAIEYWIKDLDGKTALSYAMKNENFDLARTIKYI